MSTTIKVVAPEEVYEEAGLLFYDDGQLMAELERRGITPSEYKRFYAVQYAKAQIEDARTAND